MIMTAQPPLPRTRTGAPGDTLIKAWPAFHYRLPDSRMGVGMTPVSDEWERWLAVEKRAADPGALAARTRGYRRDKPVAEQ